MFGFSLAELAVLLVIILIFIKPQDLPEIAHFLGRIFYRGKRLFRDMKNMLGEAERDLGIDELKYELNRGFAEEKAKIEDDITVIVDIYGNEHHVPNVKEIRPDLNGEQIAQEVSKLNENNVLSKKQT